jgi:hypothetical protein
VRRWSFAILIGGSTLQRKPPDRYAKSFILTTLGQANSFASS